jgi:multiple sugar transport system substrate-binding protein
MLLVINQDVKIRRSITTALLLTLILLNLVLTACGGPKTTIVFVFLSSSDEIRSYWDEVIQDFEAANPDVEVDLRVYNWTEGPEKIQQMVEDGRPPDLARVATRWVPEYVSKGLVELVDDYMTSEFRSEFFALFIEEGARYQGRTFGLPVAVSARALYYNKDLLRQAGFDAPPTTWDELREIATAISRLGDDVYGFGIPASPDTIEASTYFYYFLWGNGGAVFSPDGTKVAFDHPEGVEALTFLDSLIQEGAAPPNPLDYTRKGIEKDFVAGKLGMVITKLGGLDNQLAQEAPTMDFDVAPIPFRTTPVIPLVEDTLIMFKTSEHKELTWRFIKFIYQDEYRLAYSEREGAVPEKATVAPNTTIARRYQFFLDALPGGRFEPLSVESEKIADDVSEAIRQVYLGHKSPEEALQEAATRANERLSYSASSW